MAAKTAQLLSLLCNGLDGQAFDSQRGKKIFVFSKTSTNSYGNYQASDAYQGFFNGDKVAET
jgi:hypothetical protein